MQPLAIAAGVTIIYGSTLALFQDELKKRLAFSTVSQVSYIVLGVAILGPAAAIGGLVHLVHQGLMKITLFFGAGNYAETLGIHRVSELNGVGRRMPLTTATFTVAALGMMGVPFLAGAVTKKYLTLGADQAGKPGRRSEAIAEFVVNTLLRDLETGATCDRHLADQLILFAALAH